MRAEGAAISVAEYFWRDCFVADATRNDKEESKKLNNFEFEIWRLEFV